MLALYLTKNKSVLKYRIIFGRRFNMSTNIKHQWHLLYLKLRNEKLRIALKELKILTEQFVNILIKEKVKELNINVIGNSLANAHTESSWVEFLYNQNPYFAPLLEEKGIKLVIRNYVRPKDNTNRVIKEWFDSNRSQSSIDIWEDYFGSNHVDNVGIKPEKFRDDIAKNNSNDLGIMTAVTRDDPGVLTISIITSCTGKTLAFQKLHIKHDLGEGFEDDLFDLYSSLDSIFRINPKTFIMVGGIPTVSHPILRILNPIIKCVLCRDIKKKVVSNFPNVHYANGGKTRFIYRLDPYYLEKDGIHIINPKTGHNRVWKWDVHQGDLERIYKLIDEMVCINANIEVHRIAIPIIAAAEERPLNIKTDKKIKEHRYIAILRSLVRLLKLGVYDEKVIDAVNYFINWYKKAYPASYSNKPEIEYIEKSTESFIKKYKLRNQSLNIPCER